MWITRKFAERFWCSPTNTKSPLLQRVAGLVLHRSFRVPVGRKGRSEDSRQPRGSHRGVHQAGPVEGIDSGRGAGPTQSLHHRVAKILHTELLPAVAVLAARNHFTSE